MRFDKLVNSILEQNSLIIEKPEPGDPNWYPTMTPEESNPTLSSTLKQMGNALTSGVRWDVIKNDLAGLFKDKPQQAITQAQPQPVTQTKTEPEANTTPTTPTKVDTNQLQTMMGDIDKAVQKQAQSDPGFDADLFARSMKAQIQQEVDSLAQAGLDNTFINNAVKRNIADKIGMISRYASQYRKSPEQQNATGRTPQQIYGTQGQYWDPWAGQTSSSQINTSPNPSSTAGYMSSPKKMPFSATKSY